MSSQSLSPPPAPVTEPSDDSGEAAAPLSRTQSLLSKLLLALFILYCIEAGIFLAWAPWTTFWERAFAAWRWPELSRFMADPWVRGAITGFGLIHLVWGLHDLYRWLGRSFRREPPAA